MNKAPIVAGALCAIWAALQSPVAHAYDPASARAHCAEMQEGALDAAEDYVRTRRPLRPPSETFDTATRSCLGSVMGMKNPIRFIGFDLSSLIRSAVRGMIERFLNRACMAVQGEFDRAVWEAERYIRDRTPEFPDIPGVEIPYGQPDPGSAAAAPNGGIVPKLSNSGGNP